MGWGQPCRLRHVTSGKYLASTSDNQIVTFHRDMATEESTAFVVRQSKVANFKHHRLPNSTIHLTSPALFSISRRGQLVITNCLVMLCKCHNTKVYYNLLIKCKFPNKIYHNFLITCKFHQATSAAFLSIRISFRTTESSLTAERTRTWAQPRSSMGTRWSTFST